MMLTRSIFLLVIIFVCSIQTAIAGPIIDSVSGSLLENNVITLSGTGFGLQGPSIIVFDDFSDGAANLAATVGSWSKSANAPIDGDSARLVDGTASNQLQVGFDGTTELFLSYRISIPSGFHLPNTTRAGEYPPDSAWKLAWIFDNTDYVGYTGDDDICLPTMLGGRLNLAGNDSAFPASAENGWVSVNVGNIGNSNDWISFSTSSRATVWLKAGADPVNDNATFWFSGMSESEGHYLFSYNDRPIFDGDDGNYDNAVSQWTQLNMSGWHRTGGTNAAYDATTRVTYDDIYLATGSGAAARVEIGNDSDYSAATKLALLTPQKWTQSDISAVVRQGLFVAGEEVWVFVVDSNNFISEGYGPLVYGDINKSAGSTVDLVPPANLNADTVK